MPPQKPIDLYRLHKLIVTMYPYEFEKLQELAHKKGFTTVTAYIRFTLVQIIEKAGL